MTTPSDSAYREIPLSKGQIALIDAEDYEAISKYKWHAGWHPTTKSFYAARHSVGPKGKSVVLMHREILGLGWGDPRTGDHIDPTRTLDNRRSVNLRIATRSEQQRNRKKPSHNTTGFKGVSQYKGRYRAVIRHNGANVSLGYADTPEGAYALYCEAARAMHGDFYHLG